MILFYAGVAVGAGALLLLMLVDLIRNERRFKRETDMEMNLGPPPEVPHNVLRSEIRGGYQPTEGELDPSNPPRTGSGVPRITAANIEAVPLREELRGGVVDPGPSPDVPHNVLRGELCLNTVRFQTPPPEGAHNLAPSKIPPEGRH